LAQARRLAAAAAPRSLPGGRPVRAAEAKDLPLSITPGDEP